MSDTRFAGGRVHLPQFVDGRLAVVDTEVDAAAAEPDVDERPRADGTVAARVRRERADRGRVGGGRDPERRVRLARLPDAD